MPCYEEKWKLYGEQSHLIVLQHIFKGCRSAWFPLLTVRRRHSAEFDTL